MELYSTIANTVWGYTDELSIEFCDDGTIEHSEKREIMNAPRPYRTNLLLNKLAIKLRSGDMVLFAKIVKMMQIYKEDADLQQLAFQMQMNFEAINQKKPIGMM